MDTDSTRPGPAGGQIQRETAAREKPRPTHGLRYELRDPLADVTYRLNDFDAMVRRADKLGATRFQAIGPDGATRPVFKVDGHWQLIEPNTPARQTENFREDELTVGRSAPALSSSPEKLTEDRQAYVQQLQIGLEERYVIKRAALVIGDRPIGQTEYRYRGDVGRVAFTESAARLATDNNNPSVARSMVDVAESRGWQAIRISGHEDFKRLVWVEASLRSLRTIGYEPTQADRALLRREQAARQVNRVEPVEGTSAAAAQKASVRGSGSRKAVLVALDAVLEAQKVPARKREQIMSAAEAALARRVRDGEVHKVRLWDRDALSRSAAPTLQPERKRAREQTIHVR